MPFVCSSLNTLSRSEILQLLLSISSSLSPWQFHFVTIFVINPMDIVVERVERPRETRQQENKREMRSISDQGQEIRKEGKI
jgi:hypothetical protein